MEDVGEQKTGSAVVGKALYFGGVILVGLLVAEAVLGDPAINFYAQTTCRVQLSILNSRMNTLVARSEDVFHEMETCKLELYVAEWKVKGCTLGDIVNDRKMQRDLAGAITNRDRVLAELEQLRNISDALDRAKSITQHDYRQTKITLARVEANRYAP
jgi:hypothetical protein